MDYFYSKPSVWIFMKTRQAVLALYTDRYDEGNARVNSEVCLIQTWILPKPVKKKTKE
jgi:hypothetical protein